MTIEQLSENIYQLINITVIAFGVLIFIITSIVMSELRDIKKKLKN